MTERAVVKSPVTPEDVPLFDVETPPVVKPKRERGSGKPKWSKYRPKDPMKCDDCMLVLALAKGHGPAALRAMWRRVTKDGDLLLCYQHADQRREEDGMDPLKYEP